MKLFNIISIIFIIECNFCYSQITIKEIKTIEEKIVLKPPVYDSLENWNRSDIKNDLEYKKFIGVQIFLPPFLNSASHDKPFLYSEKVQLIMINDSSARFGYNGNLKYQQIATLVYKPKAFFYKKDYQNLYPNYDSVGNQYYTIIDVLYGDKPWKLWKRLGDSQKKLSSEKFKTFVTVFGTVSDDARDAPELIFKLRNESNNDTVYCTDVFKFILVPFFVKQKKLFENQYFIYEGEKTRESFDPRYITQYEDEQGNDIVSNKKTIMERISKWKCIDVTLLKPTYDIRYIMENSSGQQVALGEDDNRSTNNSVFEGLILEKDLIKREADKKLQQQQLIARQQQIETSWKIAQEKKIEKRRLECINKFGTSNGELIAQGKVKIGMTIEMCRYAWGTPFWTSKTTTEYEKEEDLFYSLGYSLHFQDGILKRIQE